MSELKYHIIKILKEKIENLFNIKLSLDLSKCSLVYDNKDTLSWFRIIVFDNSIYELQYFILETESYQNNWNTIFVYETFTDKEELINFIKENKINYE